MFCRVVHAPVLSGTLWSTGGPNMLCATIQTKLFELDLPLGKPGLAPALLRASCVAFGNVFIHPAPQLSPP